MLDHSSKSLPILWHVQVTMYLYRAEYGYICIFTAKRSPIFTHVILLLKIKIVIDCAVRFEDMETCKISRNSTPGAGHFRLGRRP